MIEVQKPLKFTRESKPLGSSERMEAAETPWTWPRTVFAWSVFPLLLAATHIATVAGMNFGWSPGLVVAAVSIAAGLTLMVLEWAQPYTRYWHQHQGDVPTDLAHVMFSTMLVPPLFDGLLRSALIAAAAWLSASIGLALWPTQWPLVAQLALALVVAEFGVYWWHRSCHENSFLWRFHATHHSPRRLYWLNSCRFHPVDSLAHYALETTPLVLLGAGVEVLALYTLYTAVIGMFQHANIDLKLGPLNWVFSMTELHRWHHSRKLREGNSNYGANLIVWDVVFGTRYLPADEKPAPSNMGIANMPNFPRSYFGQLASPFVWQKLEREAARSQRSGKTVDSPEPKPGGPHTSTRLSERTP